jgi:hypothetical protein
MHNRMLVCFDHEYWWFVSTSRDVIVSHECTNYSSPNGLAFCVQFGVKYIVSVTRPLGAYPPPAEVNSWETFCRLSFTLADDQLGYCEIILTNSSKVNRL